ncbi:hypothetical protein KR51_00001560 [Rubidibacter lacunae KORDI 51-2]|uniref:Uncharacterized protein n=1 Tax=Rubidibacter lacunae KORDI 51-2 TaxID=582515 RepID=U5DF34_9CHRO|nr:hypothetical protein [Rubidibacter lacunae]ERN43093.1 hypothetical protein KR51_00001560 [Rubidibacter lacunae KORDI 51-2]
MGSPVPSVAAKGNYLNVPDGDRSTPPTDNRAPSTYLAGGWLTDISPESLPRACWV